MEIKLEKVSVVFKGNGGRKEQALKQVSFTLKDGEAVALMGPIGSGKSTLLRMIAGLLKPTAGRLQVNDDKGLIVLSIQEPQRGFFAATVREEVAFGPENLGLTQTEVDRRVAWALGLVGLKREKWESSPFRLSGGEQRRVALASALAMQPSFLLLDEPTIGLDGPGETALKSALLQIRAETDIGLLVASHDPDFLYPLTKRVLLLAGGELQADTTWGPLVENFSLLAAHGLALPFLLGLLYRLKEKGAPVEAVQDSPEEAWRELTRFYQQSKEGAGS